MGGNAGFMSENSDQVTDLRILNEDKMLRVDYTKKQDYYFIDITLENQSAKMRKCNKRWEDRSA